MDDPAARYPLDYERLFRAGPSPVLVLDAGLLIVAVTDPYLQATMTERAAILGRHLFDVFPDPDDAGATGVTTLRGSLERVLSTRRADVMAVQKYDIRQPDGTFEERHWSPVNVPVLGPDGAVVYILHKVEDVTAFVTERPGVHDDLRADIARMQAEIVARGQQLQQANAHLRAAQAELERRVDERTQALRSTEAQLRHAQKLESVGRLAAGIAHDFNNMLSVVSVFTALVREDLEPASGPFADLGEVLDAADRAARLTRQLLAFSRQQVLQPRLLSLDHTAAELEVMLRRSLGDDVTLATALRAGDALVYADKGQIEQVIANLALNARDAMPGGGKLTIETAVVELDVDDVRKSKVAMAGPHVMLAITDTGSGIPPEVQARMFEPFFTTKELGKGSGLGLSTVYGIVEQSGGTIWVYSELGHGTTFKVYLPLATGTMTAAPTPDRGGDRSTGTETVLVAEDDDQVRAAVVTILERRGYEVLAASSGAGALALAINHPGVIHLLLTDLVMPDRTGRALAQEIAAERPGIRVLYMSGYTDDTVVRHGVLTSDLAFLQKPFTPSAVVARVREVLDGRPSGGR